MCVCLAERPDVAGSRRSPDEGRTTKVCKCLFAPPGWNAGCPWHSADAWSPSRHPFPLWYNLLPALEYTHPQTNTLLSTTAHLASACLSTALIKGNIISCSFQASGGSTSHLDAVMWKYSQGVLVHCDIAASFWAHFQPQRAVECYFESGDVLMFWNKQSHTHWYE